MTFRKLVLALTPLSVVLAQAHPGHGMLEHGAAHVATSPYHIFVLMAVSLVLFALAQIVSNLRCKQLFRVGSGLALAGAALVWTLGL